MLSGGPILQLPGRNVHFHDSALASGQPHTVKADQCALGELHARGAVAWCAEIDLRHFIASDGSAIAQLEAAGYGFQSREIAEKASRAMKSQAGFRC